MKRGSGRPGSGVRRRPGLWCVIFGLSMLASARAQEPAAAPEPEPAVPDSAVALPVPARIASESVEAVAAEPDSIPTTSGRGLGSPFWVMMRSVVVPGWGQATNGKWLKAILVAGVEGYFISRIVHYERERKDFEDDAGEFPDEAEFYEARAEAAAAKRRDYSWWTGLAVAISAADAFVDAHLRYFDVEFDAEDAGEGEPVVTIDVGLRIDW